MLNIRKGGHVELERFYSAMEIDFDAKELIGKWSIHRAMSAGDQELLLFSDAATGLDVGYALVLCRGLYGYVLLKYFAVLPWYRGKGLGIEAMRLINKRYADRQGILAELTAFDDTDGSYLRKLRKFFARFGYVQVESDYRLGGAPVTLIHVALLRGEAGRAGVTDIAQKQGSLRFTLEDFDMARVSALYARPEYKGRLRVEAGSKPCLSLRIQSKARVIDEARRFVADWAKSSNVS